MPAEYRAREIGTRLAETAVQANGKASWPRESGEVSVGYGEGGSGVAMFLRVRHAGKVNLRAQPAAGPSESFPVGDDDFERRLKRRHEHRTRNRRRGNRFVIATSSQVNQSLWSSRRARYA
ncbi:hypothetical protein OG943_10065 [Amycolatopsis sp. NBC_00345]|uniref:hypothetical protein n=1 Tax=Amycolatopsis sp. NBC_00345 TaxID=2975955 RepID=UPI002E263A9E